MNKEKSAIGEITKWFWDKIVGVFNHITGRESSTKRL